MSEANHPDDAYIYIDLGRQDNAGRLYLLKSATEPLAREVLTILDRQWGRTLEEGKVFRVHRA